MYCTLAVSWFGLPATHATAPIEPSEPWAGPVAILNVRSQVSGSLPARVTPTAVFCGVVTLTALAVGGVFGGGPPVPGRRTISWPTLLPESAAVATRVPVAPPAVFDWSFNDSVNLLVTPAGETISVRSDMPLGGLMLVLPVIPNSPTSRVPVTAAVAEGAVIDVDPELACPLLPAVGFAPSTPV